jgi:antitoxin component YwqK of YwqJK toxin-antitoxin module
MEQKLNKHDAEGRCHGIWKTYYPNGTLAWRGHYLHGKLHGVWEAYYINGTFGWKIHWHHGRQKGIAKTWSSQGDITQKRYHLVLR